MTTTGFHAASQPPDTLPSARLQRWQPLRGGLVDIFKYENQEFRYEAGRLILRGNNGTGKSRVLALQFPFLLDGETAPHRLEPDGDPAKRIEWNLLMGRYPERTGYTWAELGRRNPDGTEHYLTIGCGLRAVEGRGIADRWFFTTPQRVGRDLSLLTADRIVLGRERLGEALSGAGRLFREAKSYRVEMNRLLFGLDQRRYDALVGLLIQLRKPQLSRSLDEKALSAALSEALSPTSPEVVGPVAEAFRGLEEDRVALARYTAAERSVHAFMREYQRYAAIAARRAAAEVRQAHYRYETRTRELRAAEEALEVAERRLGGAGADVERLEQERGIARVEAATLESSPEKRQADDLDVARQRARELAAAADRAEERLRRTLADRSRSDGELADAIAHDRAAQREAEDMLAAAACDADTAGLRAAHESFLGSLDVSGEQAAAQSLGPAHAKLGRGIEGRRAALRVLKGLQAKVRAAQAELVKVQALVADAQSELEEALDREAETREAQARAGDGLVAAFRAWCARLHEMEVADADAVRDALEAWCAAPEGRSPIDAASAHGHDGAKRRIFEGRAGLAAQAAGVEARLRELRAQHAELASGRHVPPPPPPTRDTASRESREGGPLWKLCDFQPALGTAARAGLEAALEAAGLLDAWVTPDGRLLAEVHDTVLVAGTSPTPERGQELGVLLAPSFDRADPFFASMREETVSAVLQQIGVGPAAGHVWVGVDGRWQIGPLHGAWEKSEAQHIGHSAREVARRRRLAEIAGEIVRAEADGARLEQELDALTERERRLDDEKAAAPDGAPVVEAYTHAQAHRAAVIRCEDKVARQRGHEQARRSELNAAAEKRDGTARDLGIPDPSMDLEPLGEALGHYGRALERLVAAAKARVEAAGAEAAARARREAAAESAEQARHEAVSARDGALQAEAIHATLQTTIGAAIEEVLRRLEDARLRVRQLDDAHGLAP